MWEKKTNDIDLDKDLEDQLEHMDDVPSSWKTPTWKDSKTWDEKASDPFNRITKKKIAKAKSMSKVMKTKTKKGRKISPKFFLMGCGLFFLLFLWLVYAGLYYAVSSAGMLESLGLKMEDVKSILMIFSVLFFGLIFFGGFYLLVLNIYRLVTVKWKKLKYILWLIGGFLIVVTTIILGTLSINKIQSLIGKQTLQTNLLVVPYVITKTKNVLAEEGIPFIAPMKMKYQLNKKQIEQNVLPAIGNADITSYTVMCGNEQELTAWQNIYFNPQGGMFPDHCLYLHKWSYSLSLKVDYIDRNTQEPNTQTFQVATFDIPAEIELEPLDDTAYLNDDKTEYIIWVAPVTVKYRAQKLFTDLKLPNDHIQWDLDADGTPDLEDNAAFEHLYSNSQLHPVYYRLPDLPDWGDVWYAFDLRVIESELAQCDIQVRAVDVQKRKYSFTPQLDEMLDIKEYHYTLYDTINDVIIKKFKASDNIAHFTFAKGGKYQVNASYFTSQGEKGTCAPTDIDVGFVGNRVAFDLKWKETDDAPFVAVGDETPVSIDDEMIRVSTLPAILEFTLTDISPDPTADVSVYYEWRQLFSDRKDVFETPSIASVGKKELTFLIETKQGDKTEQTYTIDVSRASVRATINVEPDIVGEDPFQVSLDASISALHDAEDEIVYFSRDFGDGESKENVSQWKITHVYRFDEEHDNGEYYPSVRVKTKLGYEDSYRLETPITVKRKQKKVLVRVDSHPTQQVKVGDLVEYSIETDGIVTHIDRDFGNYKSFSCDDRSCVSASMRYTKAGEYLIKTEVQYEDATPVVGNVRIRVYE